MINGTNDSLMHVGSERLTHMVRSNRKATVAQIEKEVNASYDRRDSEYGVQLFF